MLNLRKFATACTLMVVLAGLASGQAAMTTTTLSSSLGSSDTVLSVASATGMSTPSVGVRTLLFMDQEAMYVTAINGTRISVVRGVRGTRRSGHIITSTIFVGPDRQEYFRDGPPLGSCTRTSLTVLPVIDVITGKAWDCVLGAPGITGSRWAAPKAFYVSAKDCTFAPTTLTTTNTYIQVGASTLAVLNGTSNAAAGTNTLTCNIFLPSIVGTGQGVIITDITLFVGSQTTAPTSLGTSTLGSIAFPAAATSETASTVTPVAVGGTVTTTSPTAITTVTTAGSFLTIKHTYASLVRLSTDRQILQYTMPFVQSAASAMAINTPGLLVHYVDDGF